jgi:purine-binding chemotaxis protein CheW
MASLDETYVLFELEGATYAISSRSVRHIDMLEHVTLVPNTHRAVDGVVFSRGEVIPVLNLRVRFGFPRAESTLRTRLIFVQAQGRTVGLIVDSAREFKTIPSSVIRPIETTLTGVSGNYLRGLANVQGRLVLLLDLEAILDLDRDESLVQSLNEVMAQAAEAGPAVPLPQ